MLNLSFHEYCKMSKNNERTESYFKICYERMYHASHIEHGIDIAMILRCAIPYHAQSLRRPDSRKLVVAFTVIVLCYCSANFINYSHIYLYKLPS